MTDVADTAAAPVDSRYASRKFILAACAILAAFAGRALGLLSPELTVDLTKWTLGLYFAGNVGASFATALATALTAKAAP